MHATVALSMLPTTSSRFEFLQQLLLSTTILQTDDIDVDKTCRNGALVPEMAVPGAYNQACMNLPERLLPLRVKGKGGKIDEVLLTIRQEASGSGKTGLAVWNSGLLLMRLVESLALKEAPNWWNDQHDVLELGCGTGLVSIAASHLGANSVLATDGNPEVVRLAKSNLELNNNIDSSSSRTIQAQVFQWGLLDSMDYSDSADLVLGADLTYNSGSWRVLAETMVNVIKPTGSVLYLSLGHEGFNVNAEVDGFLSVAKEVGLVSVDEIGGVPVSSLLQSVISPSERKVLQQSGGVKVVVLQRKQFVKK